MHSYGIEDAREERTEAYSRMQKILERAKKTGRDLLETERVEFDKAEGEFDALNRVIKGIEAAEGRAPRDGDSFRRTITPDTAVEGPAGHVLGEWLSSAIKGESFALVGSGTTGGGAFTPADTPSMFFDRLFAQSVAFQSGIRQIRTERDSVVIPRLTAEGAASWTTEGAAITEASPTADQVTATPRKLAALVQMTNEVIADSDPAILDIVGMSMVRAIALKLDLGIYEGSGTPPEIRGLKNVSGIQTVDMGTNGTAFVNLDPFADAIGLLETENTEGGAIVMHPRSWKALIKLKEQTSGNNKPLLQESAGSGSQGVQRSIYGLPVYLSSQLSITETQGSSSIASSAYLYTPSEVVAVMREDVRLKLDESRLFNEDESELRGIMRIDVVVPNPKAVVRILGIIP